MTLRNDKYYKLKEPRTLDDERWYVATEEGGHFSDYLHKNLTLGESVTDIHGSGGGWFSSVQEAKEAIQNYYNKWHNLPTKANKADAFDRAMKGI